MIDWAPTPVANEPSTLDFEAFSGLFNLSSYAPADRTRASTLLSFTPGKAVNDATNIKAAETAIINDVTYLLSQGGSDAVIARNPADHRWYTNDGTGQNLFGVIDRQVLTNRKGYATGYDALVANKNNSNTDEYVIYVAGANPVPVSAGQPLKYGEAFQASVGHNNEYFGYAYARERFTAEVLHSAGPVSQSMFVRSVSREVVHEFLHLLGVGHPFATTDHTTGKGVVTDPETGGHVVQNPQGDAGDIMNYRTRLMSEKVKNTSPLVQQYVANSSVTSFRVRYRTEDIAAEARRSLSTADDTFFDERSGRYFHDEGEPEITNEAPEVTLPPASQGTVGAKTAADIAGTFAAGLGSFRDNDVARIAGRLNLSYAPPFLAKDLGNLLGLTQLLKDQIQLPDVSAIASMAGLQAALQAAGFTIDHAVSDAQLSALRAGSPDQPADFLQAHIAYPLLDLVMQAAQTDQGFADLKALGIDLAATSDLTMLAHLGFDLVVGVDSAGFYLAPTRVLDGQIDATGSIKATFGGFGSATGTAGITLEPLVSLATAHADGRVRLADLDSAATYAFSLDASADAGLQFDFSTPLLGRDITFNGLWSWTADAAGYHYDDSHSGFDEDALLSSLSDVIRGGIGALADQSSDLAGIVGKVPYIGGALKDGLTGLFQSSLAYDDSGESTVDYLAERGFTVRTLVTPGDFIDGSFRDKSLLELQYVHTVTPSGPFHVAAGGQIDFGPARFSLSGSLDVTPSVTLDLTFGVDLAHGPYIVSGSKVSVDLAAASPLSGTLTVGNIRAAQASTTARFDAHAVLTLATAGSATGAKLGLEDGFSVADALNAGKLALTGTLSLDNLSLTLGDPTSIPVIGKYLAGALTWSANASYDLTTQQGTYTVTSTPSVANIERQIFGDFIGQLAKYNPLPASVSQALTTKIGFIGNKSVADLAHLGPVDFLFNPEAHADDPDAIDSQDGDNSVSLDYDLPGTIVGLLSGGSADIFKLNVHEHITTDLGRSLLTAFPVASFFGLLNLDVRLFLTPHASFNFDFQVGLDTSGFYVTAGDHLISVGADLTLDGDVSGDLVVVPLVTVEVSGGLGVNVGIDLHAPDGGSKVRGSDFVADDGTIKTSLLSISGGLQIVNLSVKGFLGGSTAGIKLAEKDFDPITLYSFSAGLHDLSGDRFEDFKRDMRYKAGAIACATGNFVLCAVAFAPEIQQAVKDIGEFASNEYHKALDAGNDAYNKASDYASKEAEKVDNGLADFDKNVLQPIEKYGQEELNKLINFAKNPVGSIVGGLKNIVGLGSKTDGPYLYEGADLDARLGQKYLFSIGPVGGDGVLNIGWDEAYAAGLVGNGAAALSMAVVGDQLLVSGPKFKKNVVVSYKVKTTKTITIHGVEKHKENIDEDPVEVPFNDLFSIPLSSFTSIHIVGTGLNDNILVEKDSAAFLKPMVIDAGAGNDLVAGGDGGNTILGGAGEDTLIGGNGADRLDGGDNNDVLVGFGGSDVLIGGDGDDYLDKQSLSGTGDRSGELNHLDGGTGNDTILGSPGRDVIDGGWGKDLILGGAGEDQIRGGPDSTPSGLDPADDADDIDAGAGNDIVDGGVGNDSILGGDGRDEIRSGDGNDLVFGDDQDGKFANNDTLYGGAGADVVYGGGGNDSIYGGSGADVLHGGSGDDLLYATSPENLDDPANGNDAVFGDEGRDSLYGGPSGADRPNVPVAHALAYVYLDGGDDPDILVGGSGPSRLEGGLGADFITGGPADDTLVGIEGADTLYGSGGSDQIIGSDDATGKGSLIDGGTGDNVIEGSDGRDTIYTGQGNDTIGAGEGDDTILLLSPPISRVPAPRHISIDGGLDTNTLIATGGPDAQTGVFETDAEKTQAGVFSLTGDSAGTLLTSYQHLQRATISSLRSLDLRTHNTGNTMNVDAPEAGRNRVRGDSHGSTFTDMTFFDVGDVTLDTSTDDPGYVGDRITLEDAGFKASGLNNFTVRTGPGNDSLTVLAADVRLPGRFLFQGGTGGSNARGLISLDALVVVADDNFLLADTGKPSTDRTVADSLLTFSDPMTGRGLGQIVLDSIESASLTGGSSPNRLDAGNYSGTLTLSGGSGGDTLIGGSGDNVLNGGDGDDVLIAGDDQLARPGLGSQANVLLGSRGTNLLRGGLGRDTFHADLSGTSTLDGGGDADTFIITNTPGQVTAPVGGIIIDGGGQPGDALKLVGGGGPTYNQTYLLGPAGGQGQIVSTNNHNPTGPTISQFIRFTGLASIDDSLTADKLSVTGASASAPIAGASAADLAAGRMNLTAGGVPFAAIHFANKTTPSVFLANGQVITAAAPVSQSLPGSSQAITVSLPASKPASIVASAQQDDGAILSPGVPAARSVVAQPVASGGPLASPVPSPVAGPNNRRAGAAKSHNLHPGLRHQGAAKAGRHAVVAHPKGPLGHGATAKPIRTAHRRPPTGK